MIIIADSAKTHNLHSSQQVQMAQSDSSAGEQSEKQRKVQNVAHLINLNEDPMLSRVIFHFLDQGNSTISTTARVFCPDCALIMGDAVS